MSEGQGIKPGISADTKAMMAFESGKKSTLVTYLLWFFLGGLGVHRFYLGKTGSAVILLLLFLISWPLMAVGVGFITFAIWGIWMLVDLFLIPGIVNNWNERLMMRLS